MQTQFTSTAAMVLVYRSLTVLSGFGVVFLGYQLFRIGVYEKAGELKTTWGEKSLILKQAAPGTFFALFGAAVMLMSILKGVDFRTTSSPMDTATEPSELRHASLSTVQIAYLSEVSQALKKLLNGEKISDKERQAIEKWLKIENLEIQAYKGEEHLPDGFPPTFFKQPEQQS